jgi:hypothetical protein
MKSMFTSVKPFPWTRAEVFRKGMGAFDIVITTGAETKTKHAKTLPGAIGIANNATK